MDPVYIPEFKKKVEAEGGIIVYEDEASFRQNPTLHQTWAPKGQQPQILTKGQRNSQKVFGAVHPKSARCIFRLQKDYFNHKTYIAFLERDLLPTFWKRRAGRVYLIHDNASYHKKAETYEWFSRNRRYIEVQCLPPYHPELNAAEKLWWYTRKQTTHNRYYEKEAMLQNALKTTFSKMRKKPNLIKGLVQQYL